MESICQACASLDGQGPEKTPHARLQLVRRSRHHAVMALFFRCGDCAADLSFLPGRTPADHGWRVFAARREHRMAEAA